MNGEQAVEYGVVDAILGAEKEKKEPKVES